MKITWPWVSKKKQRREGRALWSAWKVVSRDDVIKIRLPLISRAKARTRIGDAFDLGFAAGRADGSFLTLQNAMTLSVMHMELHMIRIRAGELKRENDLLKWRLMERDPEFVRDLEPEFYTVGPNVSIGGKP